RLLIHARAMFTPHPSQPARTMSSRMRRLAGALLLGMALCLPAAIQAAAANDKPTPDKTQVARINVTAAQAARTARNEYGGKVLGVRLEASDQAPYYRVK